MEWRGLEWRGSDRNGMAWLIGLAFTIDFRKKENIG